VAVTREDVEQMAALAHLRLDPEEVARMVTEMSAILDHVAALAEVDVEGVREAVGIVEGAAPFRPKGGAPDPLQRPLREIAPDFREGLFVVPRLPGVEGGDSSGLASGEGAE